MRHASNAARRVPALLPAQSSIGRALRMQSRWALIPLIVGRGFGAGGGVAARHSGDALTCKSLNWRDFIMLRRTPPAAPRRAAHTSRSNGRPPCPSQ
ncbi:hypothetical protein Bxe_A4408 [Paraburkholderia xenovorans LB400]|uniref:Uncharacterized protein n=1 Tax=Paraburkholderia xenovorans (strain LB400) TaxID=266265 RepID=Q146Z7_PARXL|nr:hypothetical protein Bxe_A4408 [Paraburkholderia xenovorans LB400]